MTQESVKVGVIAEETGALSFMGRANANVARMVVDEINTNGGLLGRKIELYLEDGATTDAVAEAKAAKLVAQDKVDVIFGGIYSSTRQAIKGPAVVKGRTLYIYPEQYEGQECDPLIFCTGPVPAQQLDPLIPWLMRRTGAKTFYLPSADYIWPHMMNERVRQLVTADGGSIVGRNGRVVAQHAQEVLGARRVCRVQLWHVAQPRRKRLIVGERGIDGEGIDPVEPGDVARRDSAAPHVEGLYGCLDYYQNISDPFSKTLLGAYDKRYPGKEQFTGGSACSGLYRGMKLWAAAVNEAGSLRQEDVIAALDHARIAEGPGGPAEMVPGQHHVRMNMYIAQAKNGRFEIVESLGAVDPDEAMVPSAAEFGRGPIA